MTPQPTNPTSATPATPLADRSMQRAVGLLIAAAILLLGFRWFNDYRQPRPAEPTREAAAHPIELNRATRSELLQLPGVGPSRVDKILAYRDARGGFQHVDELRSVEGIGDITLQRLKPHLQVDANAEPSDEPVRLVRKPAQAASPTKTSGVKKSVPEGAVDLNRAELAELQRLPGIGPALAQRIIDERLRQPFAKVDDLRRVAGIGAKRLEQIKPCARVEE